MLVFSRAFSIGEYISEKNVLITLGENRCNYLRTATKNAVRSDRLLKKPGNYATMMQFVQMITRAIEAFENADRSTRVFFFWAFAILIGLTIYEQFSF